VYSVDVGSIGRTTYKLLSYDCVRVASQDPEEELAASNFLTEPTYTNRHIKLLINGEHLSPVVQNALHINVVKGDGV
jgi:cupin superfamily acireductone dioxygenase involved in methionine salvage